MRTKNKQMIKKTIVGIFAILAIYGVAWIGLSIFFTLDRVGITIKEEYYQEFIEEQFTADDFEWGNVEGVIHHIDYPSSRHMYIYLKIHGPIPVLFAVWHFKTLEFVENADFARPYSVY